ncbi:hypothetical protein CDCA_CDCA20G4809 [Cyanidium caldarium]|uniref:ERCC4 domain-containing protein n=1 Tax=Cyanidium caldarium TaxID=2771 RepID=A0AAV9J2S0_CYACA|nr:hypothetical protein CDCA_CDCA20G4809 [Cyanidium caldarium]
MNGLMWGECGGEVSTVDVVDDSDASVVWVPSAERETPIAAEVRRRRSAWDDHDTDRSVEAWTPLAAVMGREVLGDARAGAGAGAPEGGFAEEAVGASDTEMEQVGRQLAAVLSCLGRGDGENSGSAASVASDEHPSKSRPLARTHAAGARRPSASAFGSRRVCLSQQDTVLMHGSGAFADREGQQVLQELSACLPGRVAGDDPHLFPYAILWRLRREGGRAALAPAGSPGHCRRADRCGSALPYVILRLDAPTFLQLLASPAAREAEARLVRTAFPEPVRVEWVVESLGQAMKRAQRRQATHVRGPSMPLTPQTLARVRVQLLQRHRIDLLCLPSWRDTAAHISGIDEALALAQYSDDVMDATDTLPFCRPIVAADTPMLTQRPVRRAPDSPTATSPRAKSRALLRMLQCIPRVSAAPAKAIVARYPSVRALYRAYEQCDDDHARRRLLQDLLLRDQRRLGPALSERICRVFWAREGHTAVES